MTEIVVKIGTWFLDAYISFNFLPFHLNVFESIVDFDLLNMIYILVSYAFQCVQYVFVMHNN